MQQQRSGVVACPVKQMSVFRNAHPTEAADLPPILPSNRKSPPRRSSVPMSGTAASTSPSLAARPRPPRSASLNSATLEEPSPTTRAATRREVFLFFLGVVGPIYSPGNVGASAADNRRSTRPRLALSASDVESASVRSWRRSLGLLSGRFCSLRRVHNPGRGCPR